MLKPVLAFLFCCISISFLQAQRSLSGLWSGTITNDSVTIRQDQSFEIALTQYKEKVYGFTRSSFIVNDTLYYIIKRVKGTVNGELCEIKDDDIIASNFPGKIDKGVKVTIVFRMNRADSSWHLTGDWNTNTVKKKYYALTGKTSLTEETNLDNSKLLPHLEELKLVKELDFYLAKTSPVAPIVAASKKEVATTKAKSNQSSSAKDGDTKSSQAINKSTNQQTNTSTNSTITPAILPPAALVKERKAAPPQIVTIQSDSIQLAIYDNGEIDGDTVSVLLNGEIILAKQGLKATAIRKTIYIQKELDEVSLVLYAENLGKYPPNTGLLVVTDGEQTYQVRFSADFQQNANVIFRRKK